MCRTHLCHSLYGKSDVRRSRSRHDLSRGKPQECLAGVIAIPKAGNEKHVRDNARSIEIKLTKEDLSDLDREFPPPKSKKSLPLLEAVARNKLDTKIC